MQNADTRPLVVAGSFGRGNAGDEAAWLAAGDLARQCGLDCPLHVLTRFGTSAMPEVIGLGKQDSRRRLLLRNSRAILTGGGVIEPGRKSVLARCLPALRQAGNRPISVFAGSVEAAVHYTWLDRLRLGRAVAHLRELSVRDVASAEQLRILVPKLEVQITGDIVLAMDPSHDAPLPVSLPDRYIAVSLAPRWYGDEAWTTWIANQLHHIARDLRCEVVLVPFSAMRDSDQPEHRAVAMRLSALRPGVQTTMVEQVLTPRQIGTALSKARLVVGMRLHACVMAFARRVPCIGVMYHPKLAGFARTVGIERFFFPQPLPGNQSAGHYGYRFADTQLAMCDLTPAAHSAVDTTDFSKLSTMQQRLTAAFRRCVG